MQLELVVAAIVESYVLALHMRMCMHPHRQELASYDFGTKIGYLSSSSTGRRYVSYTSTARICLHACTCMHIVRRTHVGDYRQMQRLLKKTVLGETSFRVWAPKESTRRTVNVIYTEEVESSWA